jgi:N-glycosylase/DNA lyase
MKKKDKLNGHISITSRIKTLKNSELGDSVNKRITEFEKSGRMQNDGLFNEMCFCILTANYAAEPAIRIQKAIGDGFIIYSEKKLAKQLKTLGYRFPNTRASYIVECRKHHKRLRGILMSFKEEKEIRDWLVNNVKGLGMKEASHFLRNIGFKNLAILDFHIIDVLAKTGLIKRPKTLTKKVYLQIEETLHSLGKTLKMSLAELDLYLWYMETGKILK